MDKESAENIRNYALTAIENLSHGLNLAKNNCSEEEFKEVKKMIGLSIMRIDDVLSFLYKKFPELDDLKD